MGKNHDDEEEGDSNSLSSIVLYAILFAGMAYVAKVYHFRLVAEIDYYQTSMPNNSIPLPTFRRHTNELNHSALNNILGLRNTEKALMDWQEAFYAFRYEMTV
jgi:hypothetical protein